MNKQTILSATIWMFILAACSCGKHFPEENIPAAPAYDSQSSWFKGDSLSKRGGEFDVFYICPTSVVDWVDSNGNTIHYMNILDPEQRITFDRSSWIGYRAFADKAGANFFSPYYRQITIQSWMRPLNEANDLFFGAAFEDVKRSFDYYLKNLNGGRPFVLAGHSQGSKAVIELLKASFNEQIASRLIAAYAIGFELTDTDMKSRFIKPAKDSIDTGVLILYNSVANAQSQSPVLKNTKYCINPLNWHTDNTKADKQSNLGSVWIDYKGNITKEEGQLAGAYVDTENHVLIVDGVNPNDYFNESMSSLFPLGNYHSNDISFFFRALEHNIGRRYYSFSKDKK